MELHTLIHCVRLARKKVETKPSANNRRNDNKETKGKVKAHQAAIKEAQKLKEKQCK
jgi:hypothetical protein